MCTALYVKDASLNLIRHVGPAAWEQVELFEKIGDRRRDDRPVYTPCHYCKRLVLPTWHKLRCLSLTFCYHLSDSQRAPIRTVWVLFFWLNSFKIFLSWTGFGYTLYSRFLE